MPTPGISAWTAAKQRADNDEFNALNVLNMPTGMSDERYGSVFGAEPYNIREDYNFSEDFDIGDGDYGGGVYGGGFNFMLQMGTGMMRQIGASLCTDSLCLYRDTILGSTSSATARR
jgi:hypothetical protein